MTLFYKWLGLGLATSLTLTNCIYQQPVVPMFGPGSARYSGQNHYAQQQAQARSRTAPTYPRVAQQPPAYVPPPSESRTASQAPAYPAQPSAPAPSTGFKGQGQELTYGAVYHELSVKNGGQTTELQVVIFDSRHCTLRVIDQPTSNAGGRVINSLMRQNQAIAGVNGGFFHADFSTLGQTIASGRQSGQWTSSQLVSGAVLTISREPYLIWNAEYLGSRNVSDMIQAGPRLVDGGVATSTLNRTKKADRTFVATNGRRQWAIGIARSVTLGDLGDLLTKSGALPGFQVQRALNLDGGHSSAIWARTAAGREISEPGWSTVRNYLAVVPR